MCVVWCGFLGFMGPWTLFMYVFSYWLSGKLCRFELNRFTKSTVAHCKGKCKTCKESNTPYYSL